MLHYRLKASQRATVSPQPITVIYIMNSRRFAFYLAEEGCGFYYSYMFVYFYLQAVKVSARSVQQLQRQHERDW